MKKMSEENGSVLILKRVYFSDITYTYRVENQKQKMEYLFDFEKQIEEISENIYRVSLTCRIEDSDKEIELNIKEVGEFECLEKDEKIRHTILNENAIAFLFPYLRSQICLVTTQPEQLPISLPAFNIISLFE